MRFADLATATKRARHFSSHFDGPFTPLGTTGAAIAARNYCLLLDAGDDPLEDLCVLNGWARSINRFCDAHRIADDEVAKTAFAAFLSRLWLDPVKLNV